MPDSEPDSGSRRISPTPTPAPTDFADAGGHTRPQGSTETTTVPPMDREHTGPTSTSTSTSPPVVPAPPLPATGLEVRPARAAKTSAAAVFALVFGLAALFCALTVILSPAAILFGIIGLVLAAVGLKMANKPGVTGKGVAIGGLVTALLGVVLGSVVIGGLAAVVNNDSQLNRLQRYIDDARAKLPSTDEVRSNVPGQ